MVTEVEAEGEIHRLLSQVVIVLGVETEGESAVIPILKGQLGGHHPSFRLGKVGAVPTDTLEQIAAARGNILVAVPVARLHQQSPAAAPEGLRLVGRRRDIMCKLPVEGELRPHCPAIAVRQALGRRHVLKEEERHIEGNGRELACGEVDAESRALSKEGLDAGVQRGELPSTMTAEETERKADCHAPVAQTFAEDEQMGTAEGEAFLLGLPGFEQVFPMQPGVHAPAQKGAYRIVGEDLHALLLVVVDVSLTVEHRLVESVGECPIKGTHDQAEVVERFIFEPYKGLPRP